MGLPPGSWWLAASELWVESAPPKQGRWKPALEVLPGQLRPQFLYGLAEGLEDSGPGLGWPWPWVWSKLSGLQHLEWEASPQDGQVRDPPETMVAVRVSAGPGFCLQMHLRVADMSPASSVPADPSCTYARQLETKVKLLEGDKLLPQVGGLQGGVGVSGVPCLCP